MSGVGYWPMADLHVEIEHACRLTAVHRFLPPLRAGDEDSTSQEIMTSSFSRRRPTEPFILPCIGPAINRSSEHGVMHRLPDHDQDGDGTGSS